MPETIKIIDLGECTALLTLGFHLIRLEQSESGKHKVFTFDKIHPNSTTINVEETIDSYHRRKLQVDAYSFYKAGKEIKSRIHDVNELART